jgi:phosphotransferase system enzyme I (PtsI)
MFPMISTVQELRLANALLDEVARDLIASGSPVPASVKRGIMVEVPSAAVLIHAFLPHADFVSIGTNDLTQYTLAVDRSNQRVTSYYQPADPAVLCLIRRTVRWCKRFEKPVSVCGEMAGQPIYAPLLVGMGVSALSMAPKALAEVKHVIRHSSYSAAVKLAKEALSCATAAEVEKRLAAYAATIPPY